MKDFLFTIVTVCLNSEQTIRRAFESVLAQSYDGGVEYIVVDGGSNDKTLAIIEDYEPRFLSSGHSFEWISEADFGIYDAMNKGIMAASGSLIGILNSDDFYEPDALQVVAEAMVDYPDTDIFYGFLRELMPDGQELRVYRNRYENYLMKLGCGSESAAQHPTCFVRRSVYERVGLFDISFRTAADYDFLLRAKRAGCRFKALDIVITNFSRGGASQTISDYDRREQRYRAHYKNGLISEEKYRRLERKLQRNRFKKYMKERILCLISGEKL
jgi:glycosyltransferase involved in cell wall biosynthesis